MQDQPRDEARAATVREGGNESWSEAAEMIDRPENLPTAAGSRTLGGDVPPGAGEPLFYWAFQRRGAARSFSHRASATPPQIASTRPNGHAPSRKP